MIPSGIIFDIQRFAIHDGPGIRTTLFLKGCPLACWWCHNPESISPQPQLAWVAERCTDCGRCFSTCPEGVHERLSEGTHVLHRERCRLCGRCVAGCAGDALAIRGRTITVEQAVAELVRDRPFYETSGGGVTLSGGEPLAQPAFAAAVLERCRAEGLHTCLDTSGQAAWEDFERALAWTDLVLYDFKIADPARHRRYTGVTNDLIRENLRRIDARGTPIEVRIPVIPGVNDDPENLDATAAFIAPLRAVRRVTLLAYHRLGESKYRCLGRAYPLEGIRPPEREHLDQIADRLQAAGLQTAIH